MSKLRFSREAKAASALDHPNVATVYEIGEWRDQLFIAMAFYDGETLKERLARGTMPVSDAVGLVGQVAAGLAAAHGKSVVHRDLKPANIAVTSQGTAKILDFGLAKINSAAQETGVEVTQPGTTLGTVAYMAPEQVRAEEADMRSDVWALGVIGYEMLTGRLPFPGENTFAVMHAIVSEAPPPVANLRPEAPPELARLDRGGAGEGPEQALGHVDRLRPGGSCNPWSHLGGAGTPPGRLGAIATRTRRCSNGPCRIVPGRVRLVETVRTHPVGS